MIKIPRTVVAASGNIALRRVVRVLVIALSVTAIGTVSVWAQQRGNPFAGRARGGAGLGPYGSDAGAMPHLMQVPGMMVPGMMAPADLAEHRRHASGVVAQRGEAPEVPETSTEDPWEAMFVGCAAGGFLGGFTAATTDGTIVESDVVLFTCPPASTPWAMMASTPAAAAVLAKYVPDHSQTCS